MLTPEELARLQIDCRTPNLSAVPAVAVREVPLKFGRCDYLLLVDRKPVGVVEAKKTGTRFPRFRRTVATVRRKPSRFSRS